LPHLSALGNKFVRRGSVELEEIEMAGDDEPSANIASEPGGLSAVQISGHAPLRTVAIDRQQGEVNAKRSK
jgi:hypothetical protein